MGRKWKRRSKNKHQKGKDGDDRRKQADPSKYGQERNPYQMIDGGNYKLESYYAYQGTHDMRLVKEANAEDGTKASYAACETDEEKEAERVRWLNCLKTILPASFRIGSDVDETLRERLIHELDEFVGKPMEIVFEPKGGQRRIQELDIKAETKIIAPAKKLAYIPNGYQLSLDRQTIRRNKHLNEFHDWLKIQTQAGFITRQETVSMLPPIVLDVHQHHKVLDMCAAPGSKTSQILETVSQKKPGVDHIEPLGCVVANDSDHKRAYMLVHQLRRINSPAVLITNCDAQFFPLSSFTPVAGGSSTPASATESADAPSTVRTTIEFDRVLCDVPCSGDGTARKNPGVWKKWNQLNAFGLHNIQLAIAVRGARLTKYDPNADDTDAGYLCYSTCSMNPIENEAVVAALLRAADGSLELVDVALPGLSARPGVSSWKVLCEDRSKRQIKDRAKKNNPKMVARRKAWEEKQMVESESKQGEDEEAPAKLKEEEKPMDVDDASGFKEEQTEDKEVAVKGEDDTEDAAEEDEAEDVVPLSKKKFEPTSFSTAELKACCESVGLKEFESFEDVPFNQRRRIRESCFPPTPEEAAKFHLERCLRIMPQDMDTGGFFVSLLKKVAPMTSKAQAKLEKLAKELEQNADDDDDDEEPKTKRTKVESEGDKDASEENPAAEPTADPDTEEAKVEEPASESKESEEPVEKEMARGAVKGRYLRDKDGKVSQDLGKDDFIAVPGDIFDPLIDYYGLCASSFDRNQYRIRACSDAKVLYFIGGAVKSFMDKGLQERVTVINTGLKSFARNNKECKVNYRVAQEGVHFVAPHMTKRKVSAEHTDFDMCLNTGGLQLKNFSLEFSTKVRELDMGSFVVSLNGYEDDYIKKLMVVMWRCRGDAMNCLVTKIEIDGMRSKLRSIFGGEEKTDGKSEDKPDADVEMNAEVETEADAEIET